MFVPPFWFPQEETEAPRCSGASMEASQFGEWEPGVGTEIGAQVSDVPLPPFSLVPFCCLLGRGSWRVRICSEDCLCVVWAYAELVCCVFTVKMCSAVVLGCSLWGLCPEVPRNTLSGPSGGCRERGLAEATAPGECIP